MIDIHTHILSGVDDGARLMEDSLNLAQTAVKDGIHTVIATPHHRNNRYENPKQAIIEKVASLNRVLQEKGIPLTVLPGQETAIYGEIVDDYEKGEIQTLNGTSYMFVELPSGHVPRYTEQVLFDLQMKGLVPIIVHPERNQEIQEQPELLYQLIKKGALAQLTASALTGKFGKRVKTFSHELIQANLVHFIASDAHDIKKRGFKMSEAYDTIHSQYGADMTYLFQENAELLIEGNNVFREAPERVKKKKFLGIF
ncbi:tyrosine-protein phosphatase [Mesobacillus zeae]|uniref:Tyrosine-protein phosphatase n=1 Tax=Mesobacillus zeae TaxID=1917180 RepID=A0A398B040_9BACI|nr:CpsB/CapC family capsule biosynthesis tyrosine phosphatase [Mesobacillus zeae]RID82644.1 tyrosine protein phosphatase [Mesobacillus zeae]